MGMTDIQAYTQCSGGACARHVISPTGTVRSPAARMQHAQKHQLLTARKRGKNQSQHGR
jgi:hypothetical protein